MMSIDKCLELLKQAQGVKILKVANNTLAMYDQAFYARTGYNDPFVISAYPDVKNLALYIINYIANLPDSHITQDIINILDLETAKTITSLMNTLESLIKSIADDAKINYIDYLINYELGERSVDENNRRTDEYGSKKDITDKDVSDISQKAQTDDSVDIRTDITQNVSSNVGVSLRHKTYDGYPKLRENLDPNTDSAKITTSITVESGKTQEQRAIEHLYDIAINFGEYLYELVNDILNRIDLQTQVLLSGESCCFIKFVLFWYFHGKDFNGSTAVKIDSKTGLPDFLFHNLRFMKTVKLEISNAQKIVSNIQAVAQKFYKEFYDPVIIQGAKSLDKMFDVIYNVSELLSFFNSNLMTLFKNPSSIGLAILGVLEGIVQAVLALLIAALIQAAVFLLDMLKKAILDSIAQSIKSRMYYFSVIKSNFLAYYGNQNVKVKTLHDIFELKYLPNVTGSETGFVNCGLIVNFTSLFLDVMSYAPIVELIDLVLSQLIVMLFKFMYSLLKELFDKLALEGLWANLQWKKISGLEAQLKQLWNAIDAVLKQMNKTQQQLELCILNTGRQYSTKEEDYLVKQINKLFDLKALNDLLTKMGEVPWLKELAEKLKKLIEFLKV